MKWLAIGCAVLGVAACGSLPPFNPTNSASTSSSSTGAPTTNGSTSSGSTSGSAAGSSTGSSAGSTTGKATTSGGTSTGGQGSSTGGNGTTSGSYIGLSCTYDAQTNEDSCAPYGYECSQEFPNSQPPYTCELPEENGQCSLAVGCKITAKPTLQCTMGFVNGKGQDINLCEYPCKIVSDCADSAETCIYELGVCFTNYCRTDYYGPCDVEDGGPKGQCLPYGTGGNEIGLCYQTGFDFVGTPCNPDPDGRKGEFSQCAAGGFCLPSQDDADGGRCVPVTPDAGCPDGFQSLQAFTDADWQICLADCDSNVLDGGMCPEGAVCCPTGSNCFNLTDTGQTVCLP